MEIPLLEFDSTRFVIIGLYSFLALMFIILGIRVKSRGKNTPQTRHISKFFLYVGVSLAINILYSPFKIERVQQIGSISVILLVIMGVSNLMLFTFSVKYSEKELTPNKSMMIELLIFIIGIGLYFIPDGTVIDPNDYSPHWSLVFVLYCLALTQVLMWTAIITGFSITKKMEDKTLRGRFTQFVTGLIFTEILLVSTILGNGDFLNSTIELILTMTIFPAAILIYLGVGRRLQND